MQNTTVQESGGQIDNLSEQVNTLQSIVDSLQQSNTIKQLEYELYEKQEIINQINDFYDSAWLKLIIVISLLGIILPIVAQYFQRKNLRDLTDFIRKQMNESFESRILELKTFNKQEIEKTVNSLKKKLNDIENKNKNLLIELDATTFYSQGRSEMNEKDYHSAISSFFSAAYKLANSNRPKNVRVQFARIIECLKNLESRRDIEVVDKIMKSTTPKKSLDDMLKFFDQNENKGLYEDSLDSCKSIIDRIRSNSKD